MHDCPPTRLAYDLDVMADAVRSFMDALGVPHVVVGYSWTEAVALYLAARQVDDQIHVRQGSGQGVHPY